MSKRTYCFPAFTFHVTKCIFHKRNEFVISTSGTRRQVFTVAKNSFTPVKKNMKNEFLIFILSLLIRQYIYLRQRY